MRIATQTAPMTGRIGPLSPSSPGESVSAAPADSFQTSAERRRLEKIGDFLNGTSEVLGLWSFFGMLPTGIASAFVADAVKLPFAPVFVGMETAILASAFGLGSLAQHYIQQAQVLKPQA